jgi:hypothetical protein
MINQPPKTLSPPNRRTTANDRNRSLSLQRRTTRWMVAGAVTAALALTTALATAAKTTHSSATASASTASSNTAASASLPSSSSLPTNSAQASGPSAVVTASS